MLLWPSVSDLWSTYKLQETIKSFATLSSFLPLWYSLNGTGHGTALRIWCWELHCSSARLGEGDSPKQGLSSLYHCVFRQAPFYLLCMPQVSSSCKTAPNPELQANTHQKQTIPFLGTVLLLLWHGWWISPCFPSMFCKPGDRQEDTLYVLQHQGIILLLFPINFCLSYLLRKCICFQLKQTNPDIPEFKKHLWVYTQFSECIPLTATCSTYDRVGLSRLTAFHEQAMKLSAYIWSLGCRTIDWTEVNYLEELTSLLFPRRRAFYPRSSIL